MYHYVRDLAKSRYPKIKGLDTKKFRRQLDHLESSYNFVSVEEVVAAFRYGEDLPPNSALLTFDDGYLDHYTTCFPILFDRGLQGSFYAPAKPVLENKLIDVNRIHFILACGQIDDIVRDLDRSIEKHRASHGLRTPAHYRQKWAHPNRFDPGEVIYVKRMLQLGLPERLRTNFAQSLFEKYVSVDEASFASELYCTSDQLRLMHTSGMHLGSHGKTHRWLDSLPFDEQKEEIDTSLTFLQQLGVDTKKLWTICYPSGAYNKPLLDYLCKTNCSLGFTTHADTADYKTNNPLLIPRLDTNDLPQ